MVNITQYFNTNAPQTSALPFLNSLFVQNYGLFAELGERTTYQGFVKYVVRSPQFQAMTDIIVSDIMSDDVKFEPLDYKSSGRNNIIKAKEFWRANNGIQLLPETLMDLVTFGIAYNWIGKLDPKQIEQTKELCNQLASSNIEFKERKEEVSKQLYAEAQKKFVKKLRHVAASTMTIKHNSTEVIGYVQRVGVHVKEFTPEEIIVFKLKPFNGQIYPLCPIESLLAEIYLLWLISQNEVSFFENGGRPDQMYILPKEVAGSPNHTQLIETLKKYKKIQNKHGSLVFTGDIKVEDLMKADAAMDHQDLALYVTGILALYYKIPAGRIPFLIGKAANNGDAGGLADAGYWRQISVIQSKIEEPYNYQLWEKYFGVCMKFGRGYKQDEVRETQNFMQKVQTAEQLINMGLWTYEYAAYELDIPEEVVEKALTEKKQREEEMMGGMQSGMLNQNLNKDKNVQFEPDKQMKNMQKGNTQRANFRDNPDRKEFSGRAAGMWIN